MTEVQSARTAPIAAEGRPRRLRPGAPSWTDQVWLVTRKDLRIEASSGELTTTSVFFALLVLVLTSMSFRGGADTRRLVMASAVWLSVLFAAVLSLGRSWAREREGQALAGLLTSPLRPSALFAGKVLGLLMFLGVIELVAFPVSALFFSIDVFDYVGGILLISVFATPGIAAAGTLFGSMAVRTSARDLMLSVVLFPMLSPALLMAASATREYLGGATLGELADYLKLLAVFDVAFLTGGLALFGSLIED